MKSFFNKFIWLQGRLLDKLAKKRQKFKFCWMFEKIYLSEKFSERHVSPQKVPLETLSPVLITLLTILRQKSVFSSKILKKILPTSPPFPEKITKLNIFPGNFFSWRSLYGQLKTQFWKSVFKVRKTSAESLGKVLKTLIQPKKTGYLKTLRICRIQSWQSCWNFSGIVPIFAPKFHEKNWSISKKS